MSGSKGGQGGQGGGGVGDEMALLAILVVSIAAVWLAWAKLRNVIVYTDYGLEWVGYTFLHYTGLLDNAGEQMRAYITAMLQGKYDPFTVEWQHITGVNIDLGRRTRFIVTGLIMLYVVITVFRMKGDGFRRQFTLTGETKKTIFYFLGIKINNDILKSFLSLICFLTFTKRLFIREKSEWAASGGMSFIHYQSKHWRVALPSAHFDPQRKDPSQDQARTPLEWMRDNNVPLTKRSGFNDETIEISDRGFQAQLGSVWEKIESAPVYIQALAIMFGLNRLANIQGKGKAKKQRDALRDRLNEIYVLEWDEADGIAAELVKPYLADEKFMNAVNRQCSKHAFTNTAVLGIYSWGGPFQEWGGGKGSELATAKFRWLKQKDRQLFYCLNNVGRRAFHIEGAGAISHFFAERIVGGPLTEPHCEEAVEGLEGYIEDQGVLDINEFFRIEKDFE